MPPLTKARLAQFLAETKVARLATVKPDGAPYLNPIWFYYDAGCVYISARARAQFVTNLKREPRVALCVDEPRQPHTRVLLEGQAEIMEKPPQLDPKLRQKYVDETTPGYSEATRGFPRVWIKITPRKVTSWQGAMWHRRYYA